MLTRDAELRERLASSCSLQVGELTHIEGADGVRVRIVLDGPRRMAAKSARPSRASAHPLMLRLLPLPSVLSMMTTLFGADRNICCADTPELPTIWRRQTCRHALGQPRTSKVLSAGAATTRAAVASSDAAAAARRDERGMTRRAQRLRRCSGRMRHADEPAAVVRFCSVAGSTCAVTEPCVDAEKQELGAAGEARPRLKHRELDRGESVRAARRTQATPLWTIPSSRRVGERNDALD